MRHEIQEEFRILKKKLRGLHTPMTVIQVLCALILWKVW